MRVVGASELSGETRRCSTSAQFTPAAHPVSARASMQGLFDESSGPRPAPPPRPAPRKHRPRAAAGADAPRFAGTTSERGWLASFAGTTSERGRRSAGGSRAFSFYVGARVARELFRGGGLQPDPLQSGLQLQRGRVVPQRQRGAGVVPGRLQHAQRRKLPPGLVPLSHARHHRRADVISAMLVAMVRPMRSPGRSFGSTPNGSSISTPISSIPKRA